jgi:hypothetical protein
MEYKLIDNFLPEEDYIFIKNLLIKDSSFPWYLNKKIISSDDPDKGNIQFTHTFYDTWGFKSSFGDSLAPIIDKINPKAWLRIKANLGLVSSEIKEQGWHVDYEFNCTTAIFYVNSNNGYTIFEDGTKIESVGNRFVSFNSELKHSGTTHTDSTVRSVINFNYFETGGR